MVAGLGHACVHFDNGMSCPSLRVNLGVRIQRRNIVPELALDTCSKRCLLQPSRSELCLEHACLGSVLGRNTPEEWCRSNACEPGPGAELPCTQKCMNPCQNPLQ